MRTPMRIHKRLENLTALALARAAGIASVSGGVISAGNAGVSPGDLTSPTGTNLFAFDLTPKSSGVYRVTFMLKYTLSAADTVTIQSITIPLVTAFTGTQDGKLWYETAGHALTVTGGTPVDGPASEDEIATGQITSQTKTWSAIITGTETVGERQAILFTIGTAGGANVTGMKLFCSVEEVLV